MLRTRRRYYYSPLPANSKSREVEDEGPLADSNKDFQPIFTLETTQRTFNWEGMEDKYWSEIRDWFSERVTSILMSHRWPTHVSHSRFELKPMVYKNKEVN